MGSDNEINQQKLHRGNYDLYNVTERLSDHITDEIFRHLIEAREAEEDFGEGDLVAHLDSELSEKIKKELIPAITTTATRQVKHRLTSELREQYHPESKYEHLIDKSIAGARWAMALVYMLLAFCLFSILSYTAIDVTRLTCSSFLDARSYAIAFLSGNDGQLNSHKPSFCDPNVKWLRASTIEQKAGTDLENPTTTASLAPSHFQTANLLQPSLGDPILVKAYRPHPNSGGSLEPEEESRKEDDSLSLVIAPVVKLLDLVLIGSLVVMVLIGGYENTVSRIGMRHSMPVWLGKLTISELKVKVAASIVIISSIHLLMEFLQLDFPAADHQSVNMEYYYPLIVTSVVHLVFIFSAIAITYIGKIEKDNHDQDETNS